MLTWLLVAAAFALFGGGRSRRGGNHRAAMTRETKTPRLVGVPLLLDLLAAVLDSGAPVSTALVVVGEHGSSGRSPCGPSGRSGAEAAAQLSRVGRLLELGSTPAAAWAVCKSVPELRPAAVAGVRCADSGARLAGALRAAATDIRSSRRADAMARAQRLGVWALLPLGLCFLPAFVCLGVVPVIVGVAKESLMPR